MLQLDHVTSCSIIPAQVASAALAVAATIKMYAIIKVIKPKVHLTSSIITASYFCIRELWMLNVPKVSWDYDIWCSFCVLKATNHPFPLVPMC